MLNQKDWRLRKLSNKETAGHTCEKSSVTSDEDEPADVGLCPKVSSAPTGNKPPIPLLPAAASMVVGLDLWRAPIGPRIEGSVWANVLIAGPEAEEWMPELAATTAPPCDSTTELNFCPKLARDARGYVADLLSLSEQILEDDKGTLDPIFSVCFNSVFGLCGSSFDAAGDWDLAGTLAVFEG